MDEDDEKMVEYNGGLCKWMRDGVTVADKRLAVAIPAGWELESTAVDSRSVCGELNKTNNILYYLRVCGLDFGD